jgi:DNA-directed RNA polymerase subunit beta
MPGVLDSPLTLSAPPPVESVIPPGRRFDDALGTRKRIYANILKEAAALPPVVNKKHTLRISNPAFEDPEDFSLKDQKDAILTGKTLSRRLRADLHLADNATGELLDKKRITLAQVPHMTQRGTFILNGVEHSLANQLRMRPGVYARFKENGEIESHVNVAVGKGPSHRIFLEPDTGIFKINLGQSKIPLLPALRALGVTDQEARRVWGSDIFNANNQKTEAQALTKLYRKLTRQPDPAADEETKRKTIAEAFQKMEVDPEITQRTLGHPYKGIDKHALFAITNKLLAMNRGEVGPDDRDHLAYQAVMGPEDLIGERMRYAHQALRPALWKSSFRGNLSGVLPGVLTKQLLSGITGSGLSSALEEVNPTDILDQITRVSRMGAGGIGSIDAIPNEARAVQPSHIGFIDYLRTPESSRAGVDLRFAASAVKGDDGRLYAPVIDPRTGKTVYKSPQDLATKNVAFHGELKPGARHVAAIAKGDIASIRRNDIDYLFPHPELGFNQLSQLIPLKSTVKGQREVMGSRMLAQALPLVDPEAQLVQTAIPGHGDRSYAEEYGKRTGAVFSDKGGEVLSVSPDEIKVRSPDGSVQTHELYNNFPHNRKSSLSNTPLVKPGQQVKPGEILAHSNYTDKKGVLALGKNLYTAYIPYKGHSYEDAQVISESAAKKLSSENFYQHEMEFDEHGRRGKNAFVSLFPSTYPRRLLDALDDEGVVKPGTVVEHGHPLVLMARERPRTHGQITNSKAASFSDHTLAWEHSAPGVVADVARTKKGVVVTVKSIQPMQVGDKMSGLVGDKGVVGKIVPDEEMPHDKEGRPYEVLANSLGIITRTNPGQMLEAALGKVAHKTGRTYKIHDFSGGDMTEMALNELNKHGLSDTDTVVDPTTGRHIPNIFTGMRYYLKLHHQAEAKSQGRGVGSYSAEETPAKGPEGRSKRVALQDLNALLSHNVPAVIRENNLLRGQKNTDWWAAYMAGYDPPDPGVPLVHRKFFDSLTASGIYPHREGRRIRLLALRDKDVENLAGNRELQNGETVDWKSGMKPVPGGLFDPSLTGGPGASRWSKITLAEPFPNPVAEEPIRRVLNLTEQGFDDVLAGKQELGGLTGPRAIHQALDNIDLDHELAAVRTAVETGKKSKRDEAIKKLRYLKHAKTLGLHPRDWMLSQVPVLPPLFRPVSLMQGSKIPLVADPNILYRELFEANQNLKQMKGVSDDAGEESLATYKAFKAVTGLGDPVSVKSQQKGIKGILRNVFGSSSKFGALQRKLISGAVDLVGRSTISPNPDLSMDEIGIPENKAWEMYAPFIIRRLVRGGASPLDAARLVKNKDPLASKALHEEMSNRPVIANRAPVLHKYGEMAFMPKLVKGDTLQVTPIICKGAGADFDGDSMNYHIPISDDAVREAKAKMLPSSNLFSTKDFKAHYIPNNEFAGGLYEATAPHQDNRPERVFHTEKDAIQAYHDGKIDAKDKVVILEN